MEADEFNYVKKEIMKLVSVDLNFYKSQQVQRRLNTFLLRSGQADWPSYFRAVRDDREGLRKLKDYLTINVSSFFRDPEKYQYLRENILPDLLAGQRNLKVWSAGCSYGQEPYSLSILLLEATRTRTHQIIATDLDQSALDHAKAGGPYSAEDVAAVPASLLNQYFTAELGRYRVKEAPKRQIVFQQHNLLSDRFERGFDLIICRNVVIYFTAEVKEKLYKRFCESLRPGGVLFVGGTEIISKASDIGFETAGISFYRRRAN
jgi:chemotaxis protein methyltransferase CheR